MSKYICLFASCLRYISARGLCIPKISKRQEYFHTVLQKIYIKLKNKPKLCVYRWILQKSEWMCDFYICRKTIIKVFIWNPIVQVIWSYSADTGGNLGNLYGRVVSPIGFLFFSRHTVNLETCTVFQKTRYYVVNNRCSIVMLLI